MRDIYKTAKKAQTTPVRGRVKAMMAQPRAVAQARKIARQTTGFKKGGLHKLNGSSLLKYDQIVAEEQEKAKKKAKKKLNGKQAGGTVKPMSHNSELTKWFLEQHGGTQKGKPHSTRKGRIAAGERALWRGVEEFERKRKKRRRGQQPSPQPRQRRPSPPGGGIPGLPGPKAGPPAGRPKTPREYQDPLNPFKKKKKKKKEEPGMDVKKGGVMEKGKPHSTKEGRTATTTRKNRRFLQRGFDKDSFMYKRLEPKHKKGKREERPAFKEGKAKAKDHKEKLKNLADKGIGYVKGWVGKKKGGKVKRGCANGGTVVMPTVGNDVRVRAYKQGALIHPRPRPTTVLHGRPRGVGIAKRGW